MEEREKDKKDLQRLLDQSIERAGAFLRQSFQMPDHSLSATQLIQHLQGLQIVALATTSLQGEPRVAPVGALFYRGSFYIPTVATAVRTRQVEQRSAISLTQFEGVDFAIIVHGYGTILTPAQPDFAPLESLHQDITGRSPRDWGEGVFIQVQADRFFTFARFPERFPE